MTGYFSQNEIKQNNARSALQAHVTTDEFRSASAGTCSLKDLKSFATQLNDTAIIEVMQSLGYSFDNNSKIFTKSQ